MQQYLDSLQKIMSCGVERSDRTGVGTTAVFGMEMRFDLQTGFPLMTTKKVDFEKVAIEFFFFLRGERNIKYLVDRGVNIWNDWPYKSYLQKTGAEVPPSGSKEWKSGMAEFVEQIKSDDEFAELYGDLGPVYGYQWRHWPDGKGGEIDQIQRVIDGIIATPDSRRLIVSAWNAADIDEMAVSGLPPCHLLFQFRVSEGRLDCLLTQRSADMFLGIPFNIASYALLTTMVAQVTGLMPGELIMYLGDAHIYLNHRDQVEEQLRRTPKELPGILLNPKVKDIFEFTLDDITLINYNPDQAIRAPIAV